MKALRLERYNELVFTEVPDPEIRKNEVLVRVKSCGICGSDVHGMDGSTGRRQPPVIMGHEAAGAIEAVGQDVTKWKVGQRVTFDSTDYPLNDWYTRKGLYNLSEGRQVFGVSCDEYRRDGAFAEFVAIPEHVLYEIPDSVSFDHAAMVEPFGVGFHAVRLTPVDVGETAVVVGAGMIGLCIVQALRLKGLRQIIAVDLDESRLALAKQLGADMVLNADDPQAQKKVLDFTDGRGADLAFEAVGISAGIRTAISMVRPGACVTLVGNISAQADIPLQQVVTRQIRLQGSCAICGEYPAVLSMMEKEQIAVARLLSASAPLAEGAEWFRRLHDREAGLLKVVLNP